MNSNEKSYNKGQVVKFYSRLVDFFPAEHKAFEPILAKLPVSNLLDIGCGTGRTTMNLAPKCKSYTGIDYAESMVSYCNQFFQYPHARFLQADARNMEAFEDESFDIVFFSFNGIDCVQFEDRARVLAEINRVLKANGYFIFSSHNTRNLDRKYSFRMPRNPLNLLKELKRFNMIRSLNGEKEKFVGKDHFALFDGADFFTTEVVYTLPEKQMEQLLKHGFEVTQLIDIKTCHLLSAADLVNYTEPWIYYTCRKISRPSLT